MVFTWIERESKNSLQQEEHQDGRSNPTIDSTENVPKNYGPGNSELDEAPG